MTPARRSATVVALALLVALAIGCANPPTERPPASFEEALRRARADLRLSSPVEVLQREEDGDVYVVYAADALIDGFGVIILGAHSPWPVRFTGTGDVISDAVGGIGLSMSGSEDGSSRLYAFGLIRDSRVDRVRLDLGPDGKVDIPARVPAFAEVLTFDHQVRFPPLDWRFLGRDGSTVFSPYD